MGVINGAEAEVNQGDRANGILFDHDDDKTIGYLSTKGVDELGCEKVSDEFTKRNKRSAGLDGLKDRSRAGKEQTQKASTTGIGKDSEMPDANQPTGNINGASSPTKEEGPHE